jgi:hypothetical protein
MTDRTDTDRVRKRAAAAATAVERLAQSLAHTGTEDRAVVAYIMRLRMQLPGLTSTPSMTASGSSLTPSILENCGAMTPATQQGGMGEHVRRAAPGR